MSNVKPAHADSSPLTDEVVQKVADELDELFAVEDAQEPAFLYDVRRILTAVWPNPPAQAAESVGQGEATTTARLIEMCGDAWQSMNGYTDHFDKGSKGVASVEVVAIDLANWCQVIAMASRGLHERITNENLASLQYDRLSKKYEEAEAGHAFERKRVLQCREALQAILPFIPVTSAIEGGASSYSENVRAADKVRAALACVGGAK